MSKPKPHHLLYVCCAIHHLFFPMRNQECLFAYRYHTINVTLRAYCFKNKKSKSQNAVSRVMCRPWMDIIILRTVFLKIKALKGLLHSFFGGWQNTLGIWCTHTQHHNHFWKLRNKLTKIRRFYPVWFYHKHCLYNYVFIFFAILYLLGIISRDTLVSLWLRL